MQKYIVCILKPPPFKHPVIARSGATWQSVSPDIRRFTIAIKTSYLPLDTDCFVGGLLAMTCGGRCKREGVGIRV